MLFIKATVRISAIHGLGLFAAQEIKAGTFVEAWDPTFDREFSPEQISKLHDLARDFLDHFGWHTQDGSIRVCLDDSRYINHSSNPNISLGNGEIRAKRDIAAGEELVKDYSQGATEQDAKKWRGRP